MNRQRKTSLRSEAGTPKQLLPICMIHSQHLRTWPGPMTALTRWFSLRTACAQPPVTQRFSGLSSSVMQSSPVRSSTARQSQRGPPESVQTPNPSSWWAITVGVRTVPFESLPTDVFARLVGRTHKIRPTLGPAQLFLRTKSAVGACAGCLRNSCSTTELHRRRRGIVAEARAWVSG